MGRAPCCDKTGLKKGPWTSEEDERLVAYINKHGQGNWRALPKNAGLARCGKSCRLRWTNYLRPDIKRGRFSFEEEEAIIQLHSILGNKWSAIAARLPGRTDNEIKNYWNTHIRKRLLRMGIDPVTHAPRLDLLDFSSLLKPAAAAAYYPTQTDLDTLEPLANYPDLIHLASTLLSGTPALADLQQQQLLPWLLHQAQMTQQTTAPAMAAQGDQFMQHTACQMPALVHANPTTTMQQTAGQQQQQLQEMPAPASYVDSLLDMPPAVMQMVQQQQWSSTVTSSPNNVGGSGVSTPSTTSATTAYGATTINDAAVAGDADALFNMQLSDLLNVSDYM